MLRPRITPCLLVRNKGLVKTVKFGDSKYVGDPINAVKIFNEKEVDELIVLDIDATVTGDGPDFGMIKKLAAECRMPLCYGGGIKTTEQVKRIIGLGVEKVALSSAVIETPGLVRQIADEVGSQSVVVVLDVKKNRFGKKYTVWTHNGRNNSKRSADQFVSELEGLGAGEIVLNSIDFDGQMKGYDLDLAAMIRQKSRLPLTFLGGAGEVEDIEKLIRICGVVGAAAGSLFVFKGKYRAVLINYPGASEKDALISSALGVK